MNEQNDKNLREALRRREAKRPKRQVPVDFCDKVMAEVQPDVGAGHVWLLSLPLPQL